MHLNQLKEKKTGRIFLSFQESFRVNGKNKTRTVKWIGYLDEFTNLYADPIAHFKELAELETAETKRSFEFSLSECYTFDGQYVKGDPSTHRCAGQSFMMGQFPLSQLYHKLEIDYFMNNGCHRRRHHTRRAVETYTGKVLPPGQGTLPCIQGEIPLRMQGLVRKG
jgi:hypothetical protein